VVTGHVVRFREEPTLTAGRRIRRQPLRGNVDELSIPAAGVHAHAVAYGCALVGFESIGVAPGSQRLGDDPAGTIAVANSALGLASLTLIGFSNVSCRSTRLDHEANGWRARPWTA
jgi:hypothetical protein